MSSRVRWSFRKISRSVATQPYSGRQNQVPATLEKSHDFLLSEIDLVLENYWGLRSVVGFNIDVFLGWEPVENLREGDKMQLARLSQTDDLAMFNE